MLLLIDEVVNQGSNLITSINEFEVDMLHTKHLVDILICSVSIDLLTFYGERVARLAFILLHLMLLLEYCYTVTCNHNLLLKLSSKHAHVRDELLVIIYNRCWSDMHISDN